MLLVTAAQESAQVPAQAQSGPLRPLAVTQLDERQQGSDLDSTRPVTITLSEPTPITDLLLMLVRDTRLSVVPDPDVQGTFRGELKDVTLRQALEMILQPHGYDYSVQGNLIRVFKRRFETRRFDLNYVMTRRTGSRTLSASNALRDVGSSAEVTDTDAGDIFTDLATGVQTLLSPDGRFNMDRKAALLQATDFPDRLDQIQLYLDAVQNRATRQVQIQAKVIEVELNDEFAAGIDWQLLIERAGDAVSLTQNVAPAAGGTMTVGLNIKDFTGLLTRVREPGQGERDGEPDRERAEQRAGDHARRHAGRVLQDDDADRCGDRTDSADDREPQAITEGIVLSVTPQIAGDGMINMSIIAEPDRAHGTGDIALRRHGADSQRARGRHAGARPRERNDRDCGVDGRAAAARGDEGAVPRRSAGRRRDLPRRDDEPPQDRSRHSADADDDDAGARRRRRPRMTLEAGPR